jgi:hypothetical protein
MLLAPPLAGTFATNTTTLEGQLEARQPNGPGPYERFFDLLLCQTQHGK